MKNNQIFTHILAITGTVLVGLPLAMPVILGVVSLILDGIFRLDYLMPAELFFLVLIGGILLIWAAIRIKSRIKVIGWGLAAAAGSLLLSQVAALITGLANGDAEPVGWRLGIVIAFLAIYILAVIFLFINGIMLSNTMVKTEKEKR